MDTIFLGKLAKNRDNSAWTLLRADYADLVLCLIDTSFRREGQRQLPFSKVLHALSDGINDLNLTSVDRRYEAEPRQMLSSWIDKGWFRAEINPDSPADKLVSPTEESLRALDWATSLGANEVITARTEFATLNSRVSELYQGLTEDSEAVIARLKVEIAQRQAELDRYLAGYKKDPMSANAIEELMYAIERSAKHLYQDLERLSAFAQSYDKKARTAISAEATGVVEGAKAVLKCIDELQSSGPWESFFAFYQSLGLSRDNRTLNVNLKEILRHPEVTKLQSSLVQKLKAIPSTLNKHAAYANDKLQALQANLTIFAQTQSDEQFKRSKVAVSKFLKLYDEHRTALAGVPKGNTGLLFEYEDLTVPFNIPMLRSLRGLKDDIESDLSDLTEGVGDANPSDLMAKVLGNSAVKEGVYLNFFDFLSSPYKLNGRSRVPLSEIYEAYQEVNAPESPIIHRRFSLAAAYPMVAREGLVALRTQEIVETDGGVESTFSLVWESSHALSIADPSDDNEHGSSNTPEELLRCTESQNFFIHEKTLSCIPLLDALVSWCERQVKSGRTLSSVEKDFFERAVAHLGISKRSLNVDYELYLAST